MNRRMIRVGLSLVLAVGWGAGRLPAQTPGTPVPPPGTPAIQEAPVEAGRGGFRRPLASAAHTTYWHSKATANKVGMCCSAYVDSPGCGSLHSHLVFQFGSCHGWFGEACNPFPQRPNPAPQGEYWNWNVVSQTGGITPRIETHSH
jgi:hypothetical protein